MKTLLRIMLSALLLSLIPAISSADELKEVLSKLQERYESITTLQSDFSQEVSSRGMGRPETASGKVWFKKPGKMRWEYSKPAGDLIVGDGKTVWIYQPDLNQAIERDVDAAASRMATDFLSGVGNLEKEFEARLADSKGDTWRIVLTPREESPNVKSLALEVDKKSLLIKKTEMTDHFETETRVEFRETKVNSPAPDSLFRFTPPQGVRVVRP
ncbi:MAG: outer membrane lipoprotein chaperone LolA [Candidatus Methylomirabilis sp.]|nr:outer membrane lipoprotein chaperone LolA [Deltaproteobacteria bacterium]